VPESAGAAGSAAGAGVAGASDEAGGVSGADESAPLSHPANPNKPASVAAKATVRIV